MVSRGVCRTETFESIIRNVPHHFLSITKIVWEYQVHRFHRCCWCKWYTCTSSIFIQSIANKTLYKLKCSNDFNRNLLYSILLSLFDKCTLPFTWMFSQETTIANGYTSWICKILMSLQIVSFCKLHIILFLEKWRSSLSNWITDVYTCKYHVKIFFFNSNFNFVIQNLNF